MVSLRCIKSEEGTNSKEEQNLENDAEQCALNIASEQSCDMSKIL